MDDNTFECPNCSAVIYPEMSHCPQCGQNLYPEEETGLPIDERETALTWGKILGIVLIGWLVSVGIATVIHFIVAEFVAPPYIPDLARIILYLAGPLGAIVGGYVCAGLARQNARLLGGLVGLLSLPASIILATHWVRLKLAILLNPLVLGVGLLIILAGVLGGWLYETYSQKDELQEKWKVRGWEDLLYQDLLRKVRFNGSTANRLIEYERNLNPQATRLELIQKAIDRWDRDNRW
jgi:hypothetical protein